MKLYNYVPKDLISIILKFYILSLKKQKWFVFNKHFNLYEELNFIKINNKALLNFVLTKEKFKKLILKTLNLLIIINKWVCVASFLSIL